MIASRQFMLPPSQRWTANRKARVVMDIKYGKTTFEEALKLYNLTEKELNSWMETFKEKGTVGLKATRR